MAGYRVNFTFTLYITTCNRKVMNNFVSDKVYIHISSTQYVFYCIHNIINPLIAHA